MNHSRIANSPASGQSVLGEPHRPLPRWLFSLIYRVVSGLIAFVTAAAVVWIVGAIGGRELTQSVLVLFGSLIVALVGLAEFLHAAAYATHERIERRREWREAVERLIHESPAPTLSPPPAGLTSRQRALKRATDFVVALGAIWVIAPMLCLVALLIKLDSSGPVFVRSERLGLQGKRIRLLRFRASNGRLGSWLRWSALEEIPTLFNVLEGDLALVGPLPGRSDAPPDSWINIPIAHARPGLTGPWAVEGFRGGQEYLGLHETYVRNWSLTLDLRPLLSTFAAVLVRRPTIGEALGREQKEPGRKHA